MLWKSLIHLVWKHPYDNSYPAGCFISSAFIMFGEEAVSSIYPTA